MAAAILIFSATYLVVALGRLPGLRIDRAGAAVVGASLMVGFGVLSLDEAYRAIDLDTLVLLLGMMILVAALRLSGFFALAAQLVARRARHPLTLLAGVVLTSGLLSAFLVNDTVCLMLTPLVAELALTLRRRPVPYLLAVAMASNIGSVATITGNPQNIMIGSFSGISYGSFAAALGPVAASGLLLLLIALVLGFRGEFLTRAGFAATLPPVRYHRVVLVKSMIATAKGRDHRRRAAFVDAAAETRAHLSRNRLGAAIVVRGSFHRRAGDRESGACTRHSGRGRTLRVWHACGAGRRRGVALKSRQQRSGGVDAETVYRKPRRAATRLAGAGDGIDARRKSHGLGIGCQPYRDRARAPAAHRDRFLESSHARGSRDARYHCLRPLVDELRRYLNSAPSVGAMLPYPGPVGLFSAGFQCELPC